MIQHLNIRIFGLVQGVSFRFYAKNKAEELNLAGFVNNESDGTVYIEIEGREKDLDEFVIWCREGKFKDNISDIFIEKGEIKNYSGFAIEQ